MQKIIKNGEIIPNEYHWNMTNEDPVTEHSIVPLSVWAEDHTVAAGVWLDSDQGPENLNLDSINEIKVIGIHFPVFADGRGFSYARLLRERYDYKGEIRALGNFIPDQLGYLIRVGFDAFQFNQEVNLDKALLLQQPFKVGYQGDVADPRPLFMRR